MLLANIVVAELITGVMTIDGKWLDTINRVRLPERVIEPLTVRHVGSLIPPAGVRVGFVRQVWGSVDYYRHTNTATLASTDRNWRVRCRFLSQFRASIGGCSGSV